MNRLRVYVSGPLSTGDRKANVAKACEVGLELIKLGYSPLIPHLTDHLDPDDSLGHAVWMEVDYPWVEVADAVLRLPGESKGADMEVARAQEFGIPVYNSIEELQAKPPVLGDARFHKLLREMAATHKKKAMDYGSDEDPLANLRRAVDIGVKPSVGTWIRSKDKVGRIDRSFKRGWLANESLRDSLIDLAAYCLLDIILLEEEAAND